MRSGGNINMHAGSSINVKAGGGIDVETGGNINISAGGELNVNAASLKITSSSGDTQSCSEAVDDIARDAAGGKTTIFYQTDAPIGQRVGDLWYETDVTPVVIRRYTQVSGAFWRTLGITAVHPAHRPLTLCARGF